jgi:hypothetical protein
VAIIDRVTEYAIPEHDVFVCDCRGTVLNERTVLDISGLSGEPYQLIFGVVFHKIDCLERGYSFFDPHNRRKSTPREIGIGERQCTAGRSENRVCALAVDVREVAATNRSLDVVHRRNGFIGLAVDLRQPKVGDRTRSGTRGEKRRKLLRTALINTRFGNIKDTAPRENCTAVLLRHASQKASLLHAKTHGRRTALADTNPTAVRG